jgi:hypothetical protein
VFGIDISYNQVKIQYGGVFFLCDSLNDFDDFNKKIGLKLHEEFNSKKGPITLEL